MDASIDTGSSGNYTNTPVLWKLINGGYFLILLTGNCVRILTCNWLLFVQLETEDNLV